jgi:hypothetical protein
VADHAWASPQQSTVNLRAVKVCAMAEKENLVRVLGKELRPHALWALIVWVGSLAGGAVIAALGALLQKLRHVSLDWVFIAGLFSLSFVVFAVLLYLAKKINAPQPTESLKAAPDDAAESERKTWCEGMVKEDVEKINKRVREISQRKEFHYGSGSDPYIDIITELWNGSVFQLVSFGEIAGHVTYAGKQLAGEPRVMVSVEPPLLSVGHSESVILTVRQYLSAQVAGTMEANRNRGVAIDFESVFVSFKILPPPGFAKLGTYKWQGTRFAIEETTRV